MSSGQHAAEETKGAFKGANDASEGLRKNINSFADDLLGSNKTHGSTGIHPDAQKTGNEMEKGVEGAGKKLDETMNKHNK